MKHTILTRMRFQDKNLMRKYLKMTKEFLVPSLKSQACQNFTWMLMVMPEDISFLTSEIDFPFISILNENEYIQYATSNNVTIQTRHDCDDFMYPNYIETIQKVYSENKNKYDTFLIQSQPTQLIYHTGVVNKIGKYHDKRTSMHLSICQKNVKYSIHDRGHGHMWQIANAVLNLGEGYTQWVIHGDNISCQAEYKEAMKRKNRNK